VHELDCITSYEELVRHQQQKFKSLYHVTSKSHFFPLCGVAVVKHKMAYPQRRARVVRYAATKSPFTLPRK